MRYSEIDLQCEDITWFGIDTNKHVIAFASGGIGNIPEFVCRSKEETETLYDYFYDILSITTAGHTLGTDSNPLVSEFVDLSSKGLYCFDVEMENPEGESYSKITYPDVPIALDDLPDNIKKILQNHIIDADLTRNNQVKVPHAY